jgi:Mg2+ and Co2+ transporter CorA
VVCEFFLREKLQTGWLMIIQAFNLVAQRDSQIIVRMSEESRQDNNNVRSIAVVGLLYLPGTFVSGLFGMNFFDFSDQSGQQSWVVSDKLWMYWAITLPLTLATIVVWVLAFHGKGLTWPVVGRKGTREAAKRDGV